MPRFVTTLLISGLLLLAGCSSGKQTASEKRDATAAPSAPTTNTAAAATTPTCALLTNAEVSEALGGEALTPPQPIEIAGVHECDFKPAHDARPYKYVRIFMGTAQSPDAWTKRIQEQAQTVPSKPQPVAGIGDQALYWKGDIGEGHLDVLKGGKSLSVIVDLGKFGAKDDPEKLQIGKTLAQKALDRM